MKKKINLWFIHGHSPVENGGQQIANLNLANEMSKYGFSSNIVTLDTSEFEKPRKIGNVKIYYIKNDEEFKKILNKKGVFQINLTFSLREMEIKCIEYLARKNKKFLVSFRTYPTIIPYSSLKDNPREFVERINKLKGLLKKCTIISPSIVALDSINIFDLSKVKQIRNFVKYYDKKEIEFEKRKYDFIFVGRICDYKNIPELIIAFSYLKKKNPDISLIIVGFGPDNEKIKNIAKSLEVFENITFAGDINHEKVHEFLQDSRVLVLPSYTELCPNSIVEGFLNKNKIIASKIPAHVNLLKNIKSGGLYNLGDPRMLAKLMGESLKRPMTKELKEIKKKAFLEFSSRDLIKKYCNMYKNFNNVGSRLDSYAKY